MTITTDTAAGKGLARHIISHCLEQTVEWNVDSDVEVTDECWEIMHLDTDGEYVEVHARKCGRQSTQVSRGSRMHPPEYKNHDVTLLAVARAKWSSDSPLYGDDAHITVEQEGGKPLPPDPEPEWRDR